MRIKGLQSVDNFHAVMAAEQGDSKALPPRGNKFNAERVVNEHGKFDSIHESKWSAQLIQLQQGGYIGEVKLDKRELLYVLDVNGVRIAQYEADARFDVLKDFEMPTFHGRQILRAGTHHVLDAKSPPTRKKADYVMKRNLMFALYKIKILEV